MFKALRQSVGDRGRTRTTHLIQPCCRDGRHHQGQAALAEVPVCGHDGETHTHSHIYTKVCPVSHTQSHTRLMGTVVAPRPLHLTKCLQPAVVRACSSCVRPSSRLRRMPKPSPRPASTAGEKGGHNHGHTGEGRGTHHSVQTHAQPHDRVQPRTQIRLRTQGL